MSTRMQIVVDDGELRRFRRIARGRGLTLSEWVRQVLRTASRDEPSRGADKRLAVVRAATRHDFPAGAVDAMLAEIERGYSGGSQT